MLSLDGVSKRFGAPRALDDVSFAVRGGSVHALLGENGAGKTTLMRVAFGLIAADRGSIRVPGRLAESWTVEAALAAGIGMVHQHFTNVPAMTVAENVALGGRGGLEIDAVRRTIETIGERTKLVLDPRASAAELSVAGQQRLEIVKALAHGARLLILDEPTAVLAPEEADELLRWVRAFADAGNAAVLITHKLRDAFAIADEITVLRHGRVILRSRPVETTESAVATAMIGDEPHDVMHPAQRSFADQIVVAARNAELRDGRGMTLIHQTSFEVRRGELVGIVAVEGSGQRALLRALAHRHPLFAGSLVLPEQIGFIPEDRHRDAMILDFSLAENVALRRAGSRRGVMRWRSVRHRTDQLLAAFDVRGGNASAPARNLSGGNQQKLVLARELDGAPELIVAENPTRGLDIRAMRDVHTRLRAAADSGAAVVMYSSDLDEVLSLASRMMVIHAGVVAAAPIDRDLVGRAMLGLT